MLYICVHLDIISTVIAIGVLPPQTQLVCHALLRFSYFSPNDSLMNDGVYLCLKFLSIK